MPRTAGATDKTKRTRRKQTDTEKEQRKEALNAKKQKEKKEAERLRPANTFFLPRSAIQKRSNDNDGNSNNGIGDSTIEQQQCLDNESLVTTAIPTLEEEYFVEDNVKVLTEVEEINNAITAMSYVAKGNVIGLDAEWNVTL